MPELQSIGSVVALIGVTVRLLTWRRYFTAYASKHGSAPPRSWLRARDPDPEIERARIPLLAGTVIAIVGFALLVIGLLSG